MKWCAATKVSSFFNMYARQKLRRAVDNKVGQRVLWRPEFLFFYFSMKICATRTLLPIFGWKQIVILYLPLSYSHSPLTTSKWDWKRCKTFSNMKIVCWPEIMPHEITIIPFTEVNRREKKKEKNWNYFITTKSKLFPKGGIQVWFFVFFLFFTSQTDIGIRLPFFRFFRTSKIKRNEQKKKIHEKYKSSSTQTTDDLKLWLHIHKCDSMLFECYRVV